MASGSGAATTLSWHCSKWTIASCVLLLFAVGFFHCHLHHRASAVSACLRQYLGTPHALAQLSTASDVHSFRLKSIICLPRQSCHFSAEIWYHVQRVGLSRPLLQGLASGLFGTHRFSKKQTCGNNTSAAQQSRTLSLESVQHGESHSSESGKIGGAGALLVFNSHSKALVWQSNYRTVIPTNGLTTHLDECTDLFGRCGTPTEVCCCVYNQLVSELATSTRIWQSGF